VRLFRRAVPAGPTAATTWIDTIEFPDTWVDVRQPRHQQKHRKLVARHRKELRREIAAGHILHGLEWEIVGVRGSLTG
jgi:hypothetical protein